MKPITAIIAYASGLSPKSLLDALIDSPLVDRVLVVKSEQADFSQADGFEVISGSLSSGETLDRIVDKITTECALLLTESHPLSLYTSALGTMIESIRSEQAGMVYADFFDTRGDQKLYHPLNDYQKGSVRDSFDFGPVQLFSVSAARKALKDRASSGLRYAGLYHLRLRISIDYPVHHVAEPLYVVSDIKEMPSGSTLFAYVDPKNAPVQKEMEAVFTDYLKRIGAYLPPHYLKLCKSPGASFPVEASVIIPVRNRAETIEEAVQSALSQKTDFPFNVIVVDNHSTDGTTAILSDLASRHPRLRRHSSPEDRSRYRRLLERGDLQHVLRPVCGSARFGRPLRPRPTRSKG